MRTLAEKRNDKTRRYFNPPKQDFSPAKRSLCFAFEGPLKDQYYVREGNKIYKPAGTREQAKNNTGKDYYTMKGIRIMNSELLTLIQDVIKEGLSAQKSIAEVIVAVGYASYRLGSKQNEDKNKL